MLAENPLGKLTHRPELIRREERDQMVHATSTVASLRSSALGTGRFAFDDTLTTASGRSRASRIIAIFACRLHYSCSRQNLLDSAFNGRLGCLGPHAISSDEDNVVSGFDSRVQVAYRFTHEPFGSVALDGIPNPATDGKTIPILFQVVGQHDGHNQLVRPALAGRTHALEVDWASQTKFSGNHH